MTTVRDNLIAARKLIEREDKWGKGEYEYQGFMCAIGAIAAVQCGSPGSAERSEDGKALASALPDDMEKHTFYVTIYNDAPETTHADILALFDRAIAAQE